MKTIVLSLIISVVCLSSCKKDYVCHCQYTDNGNVITSDHNLNTDNLDDAKSKCSEFQVSNGSFTWSCAVK